MEEDDDCQFLGTKLKEDDFEMSFGFSDLLSSPVRKAAPAPAPALPPAPAPAPAPAPKAPRTKAKATNNMLASPPKVAPVPTAVKVLPNMSKIPAGAKPEPPLAKARATSSSSSSSSSSSPISSSPRNSTIKTEKKVIPFSSFGTAHKASTSILTNGSGNGTPKRGLDTSKLEENTKRRKIAAEKTESVPTTKFDNSIEEPNDAAISMNFEVEPSPKSPVALVPYDDALFTESTKYPWFTLIQVSHQLVKSCLAKYSTKEQLDGFIEKAMANLDDHEYYKQPDAIRAGVKEIMQSENFTTWVKTIGRAQKKMEGNIEQTVKYIYALLQLLEKQQDKARKQVLKEQEAKQKEFGEQLRESLKVLSGNIAEGGDESIPELINKYHQTMAQLKELHTYQKESQRRSKDLKATFKFVFKHCELFEYLIEKMKAIPPVKPLPLRLQLPAP